MTPKPFTIKDAEELATKLHEGQFRRDGLTPYITHPRAVAKSLAGESDEVIMTAWLHDVLEDTNIGIGGLFEAGVPPLVVSNVMLLSCGGLQGVYTKYIEILSGVESTRKVKIADIRHNLRCDPTPKQIEKYRHALEILEPSTPPTP
jgi:hypothetical protein